MARRIHLVFEMDEINQALAERSDIVVSWSELSPSHCLIIIKITQDLGRIGHCQLDPAPNWSMYQSFHYRDNPVVLCNQLSQIFPNTTVVRSPQFQEKYDDHILELMEEGWSEKELEPFM